MEKLRLIEEEFPSCLCLDYSKHIISELSFIQDVVANPPLYKRHIREVLWRLVVRGQKEVIDTEPCPYCKAIIETRYYLIPEEKIDPRKLQAEKLWKQIKRMARNVKEIEYSGYLFYDEKTSQQGLLWYHFTHWGSSHRISKEEFLKTMRFFCHHMMNEVAFVKEEGWDWKFKQDSKGNKLEIIMHNVEECTEWADFIFKK
jgi:hypothetical protein